MTRSVRGAKEIAATVLSYAIMLALIAAGTLVSTAQCFTTSHVSSTTEFEAPVREFSPDLARDIYIASALVSAWTAAARPADQLELMIVESAEINAASFGGGRFAFWEGTADLNQDDLIAISAHEVAHDLLLHSRRSRDAKDLLGFIAEVVSIFTGTDRRGEQRLRSWIESATIPRYSRGQELEADSLAVRLLNIMGYDAPEDVFAGALDGLLRRYGDTGGDRLDYHPATSERIARLRR
jgi:predicted Zn-dependent protease